VNAISLAWLGVPTDDFEGTVAFFRDVLELAVERQ
jgi:predicted enzyme related to lactoylglutathione lyase